METILNKTMNEKNNFKIGASSNKSANSISYQFEFPVWFEYVFTFNQ